MSAIDVVEAWLNMAGDVGAKPVSAGRHMGRRTKHTWKTRISKILARLKVKP